MPRLTELQLELELNSEKGISLIPLMIINILFCYITLNYFKYRQMNQELLDRSKIYLCQRYQNKSLKSYLKRISNLNGLISIAYKSKLIIGPKAEIAIKSLQTIQYTHHISYIKKIISYKNCSKRMALEFVRRIPYRNKMLLFERDFEGKTILKKERWKTKIKSELGINLISDYHLRQKKLSIQTKELVVGKLFFGYGF